jgi:16S rRNA G966 N2-methylase RsmD
VCLFPFVPRANTYRNKANILNLPDVCLQKIRAACEANALAKRAADAAADSASRTTGAPKKKFNVHWSKLFSGHICHDKDASHEEAKALWMDAMLSTDTKVDSVEYYDLCVARVEKLHALRAIPRVGPKLSFWEEQVLSGRTDARDKKAFLQMVDLSLTSTGPAAASSRSSSSSASSSSGRRVTRASAASASSGSSAADDTHAASDSDSAAPDNAAPRDLTLQELDVLARAAALPASEDVVSHFIHMEWGDAFDLLDVTKPMEAQLILTDPPYGITKNPWDTRFSSDEYHRLQRVFSKHLKPSGTVLMFSDFEHLPEVQRTMTAGDLDSHPPFVWVKTNAFADRWAPFMHVSNALSSLIMCRVRADVFSLGSRWSVAPCRSVETVMYLHKRGETNFGEWAECKYPWVHFQHILLPHASGGEFVRATATDGSLQVVRPEQKPVRMLIFLILKHTKPGDLVLDPFMGVGSTAFACALTGRRFWGCDDDANAVHWARVRLRSVVDSFKEKRAAYNMLYSWADFNTHMMPQTDAELAKKQDPALFEEPLKAAALATSGAAPDAIFMEKPSSDDDVLQRVLNAKCAEESPEATNDAVGSRK